MHEARIVFLDYHIESNIPTLLHKNKSHTATPFTSL